MPEITLAQGTAMADRIEQMYIAMFRGMRIPERDRKLIHDSAATAHLLQQKFTAAEKRKLND